MLVFVSLLAMLGTYQCLVSPSNKHCPARCVYAANVMGKNLDIFAVGAVSLYHIL
jgi:hypothetical protein